MTAEFEIKDILVALKMLSDNEITRCEVQFDRQGNLVLHGQNKHVIRPRVIPIRILDNDISGSLEKEYLNKNQNKLSFLNKIKGFLE